MIEASAAIAAGDAPVRLLGECLARALAGHAGPPRLLLMFSTGEAEGDGARLLAGARAVAPDAVVIGCGGAGVLAIPGGRGSEPREIEGEPALAVLAVWGSEDELQLAALLAGQLDKEPAAAGQLAGALARSLSTSTSTSTSTSRALILLPDAFALRAPELFSGLATGLAGEAALVVGAAAAALPTAAGKPSAASVWSSSAPPMRGAATSHALAALALGGRFRAHAVVAQGCRPISPWRTVTRSRGNVILELDGAPAFRAFAEVARGPLGDDLPRAARSIMVGLPAEEGARSAGMRALPAHGASASAPALAEDAARVAERPYVVRGIAGFEPERGWLGLGQPIAEGTPLRFVLREPAGARAALSAALERLHAELAGRRPVLGLYFDCAGRGEGLFGLAGHDVAYIARSLGQLPLIGIFGAAEIGPSAAEVLAPALHLFSGVLLVLSVEAG